MQGLEPSLSNLGDDSLTYDIDICFIITILFTSQYEMSCPQLILGKLDSVLHPSDIIHQYYERRTEWLNKKPFLTWSDRTWKFRWYFQSQIQRQHSEYYEWRYILLLNNKNCDQRVNVKLKKVCGEMHFAIGLWLLFGASCHDLVGQSYGVKYIGSIYNFFNSTIYWINMTFKFELLELLQKFKERDQIILSKLKEISSKFATDSDMVINWYIGAIGGLVIRIKCPTKVPDPGNYFCCKNVYALNIQAICDWNKRCLWLSPGRQGASHDSFAWRETKSLSLLTSCWSSPYVEEL